MEPFKVFISSSQKEFEELRRNLKSVIDIEELVHQQIFRAILVELKKGTTIEADIDEGMSDCSIYIGIFGRDYSEITAQEFRKARANLLPTLIYRVRRARRGRGAKHSVTGGRSKVDKFLREEVRAYGIRIRGPYSTEDELEKDIMIDLAFQVADMVKESARIRKIIGR